MSKGTEEIMKEFTSSNGMKMVEGELFNWKIEPIYHGKEVPFAYSMHVGCMSDMYQALYHPDEEILSICSLAYSSNETFKFYCMDIWTAELIVHAFIKGQDIDISETIYKK
jgi:hypothetical protein